MYNMLNTHVKFATGQKQFKQLSGENNPRVHVHVYKIYKTNVISYFLWTAGNSYLLAYVYYTY